MFDTENMGKVPVSVVVLTKNEELNIAACLESVSGWVDEIIVVDDQSSDRTLEIARQYTDKILVKRMDVEGRHRNWAYQQAKNEWVLSLDADEKVSPELEREITNLLKDNPEYDAFSIPLKNFIGDHWVRFGGWYPAGKVRLFKKERFKYEEVEVHPRVFIEGRWGYLKGDIIHRGYPSFGHFLSSLNRQTTLEARKWLNTDRRMSLAHALWRTVDRFVRTFVSKKGYKDGLIGFMVALFAGFYQILSYAKYWELKAKTRTR